MQSNIKYRFHDVEVDVRSSIEALASFIAEYSFLSLKESEPESMKRISLEFSSGDAGEFNEAIPKDAELKLEIPFEVGEGVTLRHYSRGTFETWQLYNGYGLVYINTEARTIQSVLATQAAPLDIVSFIVLFIQPVIRMLGRYGYQRLHAACIQVNGSGILITGQSGRGKSTATFALRQNGHPVLSDEMPLVRREGAGYVAYALANFAKLSREALQRFFPNAGSISNRCGEDCYLKLTDLNTADGIMVAAVSRIFVLERTGRAETEITAATPLEIVPELFPCTISALHPYQAEGSFQTVMELLDTVACFKIHFGTDMSQFAKAVEEVVASC